MTVSSETARMEHAGNDVTVEFAISFYFLANADISAVLSVDATGAETALSLTTHYTLADAGEAAGGTLTMVTAPATGETLTIIRDVAATQGTDYVENSSFPADSHEMAVDRLTMLVQKLQEQIDRALLQNVSQQNTITLPVPVADYYLKFNSAGDDLIAAAQSLLEGYTISAYGETLFDDADAAEARSTLEVVPASLTTKGLQYLFPGAFSRSKIEYKDADEFYLGPGAYMVKGKFAYWSSQLTETIVGLAATTRHYVYLDHSAITSGTIITNTEIIVSTTAPTWNATYQQLMNGDDRCIFGFITGGANTLLEWHHDGGDLVVWDAGFSEYSDDLDDSFVEMDLATSVPAFCTKALIQFDFDWNNAAENYCYIKPKGGTGNRTTGLGYGANTRGCNTTAVLLDSAQVFEAKMALSNSDTMRVTVDGFYLPIGM